MLSVHCANIISNFANFEPPQAKALSPADLMSFFVHTAQPNHSPEVSVTARQSKFEVLKCKNENGSFYKLVPKTAFKLAEF